MLASWVERLREARTADEVVSFAAWHLDRLRARGELPAMISGRSVDDGEDVRQIASALAQGPFVYNAPGYEGVLDQQLLILFSLAADRLAQLEGWGITRRSSEPVIRAP
jgi:hypothetical protein